MVMFSELLRTAAIDGEALTLDVPGDWAQGRSIFGGLQAAFAVQAMRRHVPATPLRTLQVTFIGPISGRMRAEATVLRTGSSATHVEAKILGDGGLAAIVIGVFGKPRTSLVEISMKQPAIERTHSMTMPYIEGVVPAFIQHFEGTWLQGALPFSGGKDTHHVIEIGMRDDGPASELHAIALADFIPPLALTFLRVPAPGSSVTWMLELLTDRFDDVRNWRIDADLMAARDGYSHQSLVLWGPDGRAIALGRQTMMVFA
jgi:acyl-CoA thioesterase